MGENVNIIAEVRRRVEDILAGCRGPIVAGVSGGADSVALLCTLTACGRDTVAVHCNFHLRGAESDRDELFVRDLAAQLGVRLEVFGFDTAGYCHNRRISVETGCRELRYREFFRIADEIGGHVAVAHNSDDNVETFMLNLMRGAGLRGLAAMSADNGRVLRPLITTSRAEIESYLAAIGRSYIIDSTNASSDFGRNFIRNRVLPLLEERWPSARKSILSSQDNIRRSEMLLDDLAGRVTAGGVLPHEEVRRAADPVTLVRLFASPAGISPVQAREMARHSQSPLPGKKWITPTHTIWSERRGFRAVPAEGPKEDNIRMNCLALEASEELLERIRSEKGCRRLYTTLPPGEIEWRHPAEGDRIRPLGCGGSARISKIMKDARLSATEKGEVALAVARATGDIIWAEGLKRSSLWLVGPETKIIYMYRREQ